MNDTDNTPEQSAQDGQGAAASEKPTAAPAVVAAAPRGSEPVAGRAVPAATPGDAIPPPAPAPAPSAELGARLAGIEWSVGQALGALAAASQQATAVAEAVEGLTKQVSFLPPQIRQLGTKLDGLGSAISEPKYRGLLTGLLGLYDLVDQVLRSQPATDANDPQGDHRRNYEVLRTQIRQLLTANEIEEIPASGAFDPAAHRSVRRMETADPAAANQIVEVVRVGFRSQQAVLRYADVVVATYKPTESPAAPQGGSPEKN